MYFIQSALFFLSGTHWLDLANPPANTNSTKNNEVLSFLKVNDSETGGVPSYKIRSQHLQQAQAHLLDAFEEFCPGNGTKLRQAITALDQCLGQVDDSLTICESVPQYALNCTRPLINVFEDCLPSNAKGLAWVAARNSIGIVDYMCGLTGESLIELLNPCPFKRPYSDEIIEPPQECENIPNFFIRHKHGNFPTPSEICGFFVDLQKCMRESLNLSCKTTKTRDVWQGVFKELKCYSNE